jgi:hypothetical protein
MPTRSKPKRRLDDYPYMPPKYPEGTRVRVTIPAEKRREYAWGLAALFEGTQGEVERYSHVSTHGDDGRPGPAYLVRFDTPIAFNAAILTAFWFPPSQLRAALRVK